MAGKPSPLSLAERFWSKVHKQPGDACWLWRAALGSRGYGLYTFRVAPGRSKGTTAHRVAWELTHGPIPTGLVVCHLCDNPPCVRPDHLALSTNAANSYDARKKGRIQWARGEAQGHAKLTTADVERITLLGNTMARRDMAKELNVHPETIRAVQLGISWKHIPRETPPRRTQKEAVAKLTPDQVEAILALQGHATQQEIADRFGISRSLVSNIHHGLIWKNIPGARTPRKSRRKLSVQHVLAIRASNNKVSQREIARQFGITRSYVSRLLAGKSWTHLPELD